MNVITITSLGITVTAAQVAQFVVEYGIPTVLGLFATYATQGMKATNLRWAALLPDRWRTYFYRVLTAAVCVTLNTVFTFALTGGVDWSLIPESFLSYLTAVSAYDHLFKKKSPPEQEA